MLSALFRPRAAIGGVPWENNDTANGGWGFWPGEGGGRSASGIRVDEMTASRLLAVYGSASFITDEISTLPVNIDDADRPDWVDNPSEGLDRIGWLSQNVWSLLLSGNAYNAVLGNPANPSAFEPLDPDRVQVVRDRGRKVFLVAGEPARFPVAHIPGRMRPGDLVGMSPVEYARQSIGLGLAAQHYGSEFFDGEGDMPGVIELPHPAQPETLRNLARQWQRKRRKGGRGLPGVLEAGASWKPTGVTNEQAQFLQTRKFTAAEIAGQMFLLDPSDLGIPVEGSNLTYANLQQRDQRRMRVALMPWIRRIESQMSFWVTGGDYRFDVDAHLRGNTKESYETAKVAIDAGLFTADWASTEIFGFPPEAVGDGVTEPTARELAEMIQKIYLGVGVVVTADEAREILNNGGADLPANFAPTPKETAG